MQETFLTVQELAAALRVSRQTLARLCTSGILPSPIRLGRGLRWRASVVDQALDTLAGDRGGQAEVEEANHGPETTQAGGYLPLREERP